MAAVEARLAGLSSRADVLLERHRHLLSRLNLNIIFNRSTLATKYWLPLPEFNDFVSSADVSRADSGHDGAGQPLAWALEESIRCLERFDELATQSCVSTCVEQLSGESTAALPMPFLE